MARRRFTDMTPGDVFIRKGPVYVAGKLAFTAARDIYFETFCEPKDIIRPDGTTPKEGDPMTPLEHLVLVEWVEFTQ